MKARELNKIGFPKGPIVADILKACGDARSTGMSAVEVRDAVNALHANPESMLDSPQFGAIAAELINGAPNNYNIRDECEASGLYQVWGAEQIDSGAIKQMEYAVRLPISVGGALMPDAHLGYGLPIGGVLATEGAVIPYAVGVDIACRMMLSVLPMPIEEGGPDPIDKNEDELIRAVTKHTRFGAGAKFRGRERREAPVMDRDWNISPIIRRVRAKAEEQLGTSGGGNHFVDIGELEFPAELRGVPAGRYVAILTHSGSRGPGAMTCEYYSKLAMSQHPNIPREYKHLSWLPLDGDGAEYWEAMQLMGEFASANHHCIHATILRELKLKPLLQIENHHNFAWKEMHGGREVIVHRKGATPAAKGDIGIIPGSMASPAYVVEGKGNHASYDSAAHGAGRVMSRTQAKQTFAWNPVRKDLVRQRVKLISAGIDEVPGVYKNIDQVMAAQADLVDTRARFLPRIVKMADDGFVED